MSVSDVLQKYWGFGELRPLQDEAITSAIEGRDALIVMPTGGGKSLCFQVPPVVTDQLTVVISPLISLMKDQVDGLQLVGYPATALNSSMDVETSNRVEESVRQGKVKLLYVSPERILTNTCMALLRAAKVARIAIDEAHCISQWGHDFRPEYRQLARLRSVFPDVPIHALTATATPRVRDDVILQLGLRDPDVLVGCFDRPNLTYRVVPKSDPIGQILAAVRANPDDAAIVYCISRKDTEKTAAALKARGVSAAAYHAGLDASERRRVSEDFAQERLNVVVATVAFGMGIDRSNVRCVIHESMPKSIESYQQETGRAGRDGIASECLMLYAPNDYIRWERVIRESGSPDQIALQVGMIDEVRRFAVGTKCRHAFLSEYFGQGYTPPDGGSCGACDLCMEGWQVVPNSTKLGHQIIAIVSALQRASDVGFGGRHVAEVLAGSKTKGIRQFGHESLRGYGAMAGTPIERITTWVHQLVDLGLLRRVGGQYPVLQVTPEGTTALNTRAEIRLRDVALPITKRQRQGDRPESFDERIFEALRQARREIAIDRGVPAYVIFHDSVLMAIASQRPTTADGLAHITGMGEKRTAEFGEIVLRIVRAEVEARKLASDLAPGQAAQPTIKVENTTAYRLKSYFEQGLPLEEIAEVAGLSKSTVANYLSDSIVSGAISDISPWVPADVDGRIRAAIDEHGSLRLRPIFEALEEAVPYDQIRLVVRLAEREQSALPC